MNQDEIRKKLKILKVVKGIDNQMIAE